MYGMVSPGSAGRAYVSTRTTVKGDRRTAASVSRAGSQPWSRVREKGAASRCRRRFHPGGAATCSAKTKMPPGAQDAGDLGEGSVLIAYGTQHARRQHAVHTVVGQREVLGEGVQRRLAVAVVAGGAGEVGASPLVRLRPDPVHAGAQLAEIAPPARADLQHRAVQPFDPGRLGCLVGGESPLRHASSPAEGR